MCDPEAIFGSENVPELIGVEIELRELLVLDTDVDDTGRLCPAKKWGLTSNDDTIEATDVVFGEERGRWKR